MTELRETRREQTALRRIASLVAREVAQPELFGAIADELRGLTGMTEVRMLRFDGDGSAVVVGCSGRREVFGVGSRQRLIGDSAVDRADVSGKITHGEPVNTPPRY